MTTPRSSADLLYNTQLYERAIASEKLGHDVMRRVEELIAQSGGHDAHLDTPLGEVWSDVYVTSLGLTKLMDACRDCRHESRKEHEGHAVMERKLVLACAVAEQLLASAVDQGTSEGKGGGSRRKASLGQLVTTEAASISLSRLV